MKIKHSEQSRRSFLSRLSKASLLGMTGLSPALVRAATHEQPATSEPAHTFLCKPYLQYPAPGTISINWITARPCYSWVTFGTNGQLQEKAHHVTNGLVDANNRLHRIELSHLQPGRQYSYQVHSKDIVDFQPYRLTYGDTISSETYTFTAPDPHAHTVSWSILNDIHDRPASIPHLLQLQAGEPGDFVFLNGDIFDYQSDEQQIIDHLLTPAGESFSTHTPFLYVRGNHETRGKYAREWHRYFDNPGQGNYFSFTWGPVFAIVLDTGEDKEDTHPVYAGITDFDAYRAHQAVWLEQQLQSAAYKKAKHKIVMMHIPPYHAGEWHGPVHCREMFGPLFNKYKIDMLICGHTHTYGIHAPDKTQHHYPIIIGGGPKDGNRTLIKIKADPQKLVLTLLKDDGTTIGTYTV
ncbi:purple acid phosphatase family protein [Chitinophaga nivalis]|uniref:Metallophosphoesterase family protein n=1 Tax=Chitinophaga nivalis TaxID=2991709 RepID=A0ABT3IT05_9BACT|nr:metallophosphoesterase family protein [Chitinophaga nivalis]MCW3463208.1 metallophosphoesterase family protein [Chitinophaga nivalis]MCW3487102.1 metallophosphoesterase family protein [Chitinophaga nivalis]